MSAVCVFFSHRSIIERREREIARIANLQLCCWPRYLQHYNIMCKKKNLTGSGNIFRCSCESSGDLMEEHCKTESCASVLAVTCTSCCTSYCASADSLYVSAFTCVCVVVCNKVLFLFGDNKVCACERAL